MNLIDWDDYTQIIERRFTYDKEKPPKVPPLDWLKELNNIR